MGSLNVVAAGFVVAALLVTATLVECMQHLVLSSAFTMLRALNEPAVKAGTSGYNSLPLTSLQAVLVCHFLSLEEYSACFNNDPQI